MAAIARVEWDRPMRSARTALLLVLLVVVVPLPAAHGLQGPASITPLPAVTDSDERFGIGNVYPDPHWFTLARNAGMRWNRWEFRWSSIEPRQGQFNWTGSDLVVASNQAERLN